MLTVSTASSKLFAPPHDTSSSFPDQTLLARIQGEFREMPGLCLTGPQAQRLWQLDSGTCDSLLSELVTSGFLVITGEGRYVRPS